jgi:hypothetical protein
MGLSLKHRADAAWTSILALYKSIGINTPSIFLPMPETEDDNSPRRGSWPPSGAFGTFESSGYSIKPEMGSLMPCGRNRKRAGENAHAPIIPRNRM